MVGLPLTATLAVAAPDQPPGAPTDAATDATTPGGEATSGSGTPGPSATTSTQPTEPSDPEADDPGSGDPLDVSIDALTPGSLPASGKVTIRGRVTNRTEDPWTDLAVYAATSTTRITTEAQLDDAESSPVGVEPADYLRIVEPGLFELMGDLAPGESAPFELTLPRARLRIPTTPGVYRLGVQVLGTEPQGRIDGADGRDRLLVVVPPRTKTPTPLAVSLQVRRRTVRTATGEVERTQGWERVLSPEGRLHHLVGMLASARRYPVAAVIDPAIVEAAGSLAAGNPGLDLTTEEVPGVQETSDDTSEEPSSTESPSSSATPDPSASPAAPDDDPDTGATEEESPLTQEAVDWLRGLRRVSTRVDVQSLPYGDLDLGASVREGSPELIGRSLSTGISLLSDFGIQSSGLLAPYHGLMGQATADETPDGVPALVSRRSLVNAVVDDEGVEVLDRAAGEVPAALEGAAGSPVWTYEGLRAPAGAAAGDSALAMRQRILARSAVQALSRPGEPMLAVLPPQWQPGAQWRSAAFFAGLRRAPWITPTRVDELTPGAGPRLVSPRPEGSATTQATEPTAALALSYPDSQVRRELPPVLFRAARTLTRRGEVLAELVVDGDPLGPLVERQAMLGLSIHSRGHVRATEGRLAAADNVLRASVRDVEVQAPRFVRMSSEQGSFLVPVVNRLDVAVQVQLSPQVTEGGLRLDVPDPLVVGPGARRPIRVEATSSSIGIRSVQLDLVTVSGERLYRGPTLAIRSSQVAQWVWVAMGIGAGILFIAILTRIVRRVRRRSGVPSAPQPGGNPRLDGSEARR